MSDETLKPPLRCLASYINAFGEKCVEWFRYYPERGRLWRRDGSSRFYATECLTVVENSRNDPEAVALITAASQTRDR